MNLAEARKLARTVQAEHFAAACKDRESPHSNSAEALSQHVLELADEVERLRATLDYIADLTTPEYTPHGMAHMQGVVNTSATVALATAKEGEQRRYEKQDEYGRDLSERPRGDTGP